MNTKAGFSAAALAKVSTGPFSLLVIMKSVSTTKLKVLEVPLGGKVVKEGYGDSQLGHPIHDHVHVIGRFRFQSGQRDNLGEIAGRIGPKSLRSRVSCEIWISPIVNFDRGCLVGSNKHIGIRGRNTAHDRPVRQHLTQGRARCYALGNDPKDSGISSDLRKVSPARDDEILLLDY